MILIKKEDSIVDILKKINKTESNEIVLDFPFWHPVLHNHLSLKIIQTKTRNKKLTIISSDKTAKKIAKVLGIKFTKNKLNKENNVITTQDILKQNFTFLEYAKFEIRFFFQKINNFIKWNLKSSKKINSIYYYKNKYWNSSKNIIFYFILILTLIFLLLLYIYYIAINKTYITIYPEINLNNKSRNFTFIERNTVNINKYDYIKNKVYITKISEKVTVSKKIASSWITQNENELAKWNVIFYNYLDEDTFILKNTSLENKEWIQFFLPKGINIPKSIKKNWKIIPWEKKALLYWKIKLINWDYSWVKSNIWTGVLLTIPKLGKDNIKIFAKSINKFTWGSNNFINILTNKDIENAKKLMTDLLKDSAIEKIKEDIKENNIQNSIELDLLPIDNIFKFDNLKINIPEELKAWDQIKDFNIYWEIEISSYIYNKKAVISLLKSSINNTLIPEYQKIISINEDSLRISHIIKRNDLKKIKWRYIYLQKMNIPFIVKATTEIEYLLSKKIDNKNSNFIQEVKQKILAKDKKEAEKILVNKPEINNVKIEIQPFFIKKISSLPENIEIIIEE